MNKLKTEIKMINKYSRKNNNLAYLCCPSARLPAKNHNYNKKYPVTQKPICFINLSSAYLTPKSVHNYYRHPNS